MDSSTARTVPSITVPPTPDSVLVDLARFQLQVEPGGGRICEPYSVRTCPRHEAMLRLSVPGPRRWRSLWRQPRWECPVCGRRR